MESIRQTCRITSDVNCEPLSDNISSGKPVREKTSTRASATASVVIDLRGIASGYLVATSTTVSTQRAPRADTGEMGPIRSIATLENGTSITGNLWNGAGGTLPLGQVRWQISQERQYSLTSRLYPGQKKNGLIRLNVLPAPM